MSLGAATTSLAGAQVSTQQPTMSSSPAASCTVQQPAHKKEGANGTHCTDGWPADYIGHSRPMAVNENLFTSAADSTWQIFLLTLPLLALGIELAPHIVAMATRLPASARRYGTHRRSGHRALLRLLLMGCSLAPCCGMFAQQFTSVESELERWISHARTISQDIAFLQYLAGLHGVLHVADSVRRWLRRRSEAVATYGAPVDPSRQQIQDAANALYREHGLVDRGAWLEQTDGAVICQLSQSQQAALDSAVSAARSANAGYLVEDAGPAVRPPPLSTRRSPDGKLIKRGRGSGRGIGAGRGGSRSSPLPLGSTAVPATPPPVFAASATVVSLGSTVATVDTAPDREDRLANSRAKRKLFANLGESESLAAHVQVASEEAGAARGGRSSVRRAAAHAERITYQRAACDLFATAPPHLLYAAAFCYRLLRLPGAKELRQQRVAHRARLSSTPQPMTFDVGYDAGSGTFSFRSPSGCVLTEHPSGATGVIPAYAADGSVIAPLQPPSTSSFDLRPEASGAWCYVDTANGTVQWHAPTGSEALVTRLLSTTPFDCDLEPPTLHPRSSLGTLKLWSDWVPLYEDANGAAFVLNRQTGSVRAATWVSLRTNAGRVYFANLVTRETRWFPPLRWMDDWMSRPTVHTDASGLVPARSTCMFDGQLTRGRLPFTVARKLVEGGAPYLHERGLPPYATDDYDTHLTHPALVSPSVLT